MGRLRVGLGESGLRVFPATGRRAGMCTASQALEGRPPSHAPAGGEALPAGLLPHPPGQPSRGRGCEESEGVATSVAGPPPWTSQFPAGLEGGLGRGAPLQSSSTELRREVITGGEKEVKSGSFHHWPVLLNLFQTHSFAGVSFKFLTLPNGCPS